MRHCGYKYLLCKSSCDLENEVKITKTQSLLKLVPMIYPGKYGGIPSTGSRYIVGTRFCHANAEDAANTNGIRTEIYMSPPHHWWGGHTDILNGFDVTERTWVCGRNGKFHCSKGNNSKSMQSRVTVPALCTSSHPPEHLFEVSWKYLKRFWSYRANTSLW